MSTRYNNICMSWCLENDIKIYPIVWKEANPESPPRLSIQVDYQGYKQTGDIQWSQKKRNDKYGSINMYKRIQQLYCHYYKRDSV